MTIAAFYTQNINIIKDKKAKKFYKFVKVTGC